ncbi:GxGYxY sequence motif-containing protein [Chitinophaga sp. CF118]|uniref:GxGYxYP domain-containing protein n=1 Tax=Chitinophaga sp. CF118 TaxID=1884367 RepID=UPI0008EE7348|nr:GxGYxYP domain-containing protein [Chitinophaga sp. CF118]SFD88846.1 GxGYxY sequence motif-containing protein [Chitinophaga sp. CF118]
MKKRVVFTLFVAAGIGCFACSKTNNQSTAVTVNPTDTGIVKNTLLLNKGVLHQKGTALKSICVISGNNLSAEQKVLVATLQGLVAKTSSDQIYIDEGGPSTVWVNYLNSKYGITISNYSTWTDLLTHFKSKIKGYVLYNRATNERSLTAATSLCGPMNAIAVDASLESAVRSAGITTRKLDVRTRDEKWVYSNYPAAFSKALGAELTPTINHHLRDYITLTNAFTFYDGETTWRKTVLQGLDPEAFCFGYGKEEFSMVSNAAQAGIVMLPTDLAANLAPLSSIYDPNPIRQQASTTPVTESNVHYVTFLVSDGDNIAYDLWSLQNYFSNPIRGTFNMGYTISPSLVDLAPATLRWYYENASAKDCFVAGPSGSGYTFPSKMPAASLNKYLDRLNTFMDKSDLRIVNILDQGVIGRMDLWNKYLSHSNIDGLIYTGYGEAPNGSIQFSENGKPVIEARDNLWAGLEEEATVISNINSRPTDPSNASGYTLVFVHTWTKDLSNIKTVVDGLNSNVRVVTPDAFVKLVKANLGGK